MLVKHNNNSISNLTSVNLPQGKMTLISEQTASGSASISFTSGIDSTYPIYRFEFINMHPSVDNVDLTINFSTDGGSNYNVTKTTTFFWSYHDEADTTAQIGYASSNDLAQGTGNQPISSNPGFDNDQATSGYLHLFNPSSTTYVKHFISTSNSTEPADYSVNSFSAGYGNTTSAINAVRFSFETGNIDFGTIKLYGIKGD